MAKPKQLPARVDFEAYQGDDWTRMFEPIYKDSATNTMVALDMTGWTGRMQIRNASGTAILAEASSANGQIFTAWQDSNGKVWPLMVHFTSAQTAALPAGLVGEYDIELIKADGKPVTMYKGNFCVEGDITR